MFSNKSLLISIAVLILTLNTVSVKNLKAQTPKLGEGAPIKIELKKVQFTSEDKYSNIMRKSRAHFYEQPSFTDNVICNMIFF